MRYIDKSETVYAEKAHRIIDEYIDEQWSEEVSGYINLDYRGIKSSLSQVFTEEQKGCCCYCMRTLKEGMSTTLEHIIPNKLQNQEEYDRYIDTGLCRKEMIVFKPMVDFSERLSCPPYPHDLAYENLVASCDGKLVDHKGKEIKTFTHLCCNNNRGESYIHPFFFMEDIASLLTYEADGSISYADDSWVQMLGEKVLNLLHRTLQMIRKTWCVVCMEYSVEEINQAIGDEELRLEILADKRLTSQERETFCNATYWSLFTEFSWFYQYYKDKKESYPVKGSFTH